MDIDALELAMKTLMNEFLSIHRYFSDELYSLDDAVHRGEGCLAVEMELAGVEAVCDFHGLELYDFLECGDVLGESGWDIENLPAANHDLGKFMIAFEIAKRISSRGRSLKTEKKLMDRKPKVNRTYSS